MMVEQDERLGTSGGLRSDPQRRLRVWDSAKRLSLSVFAVAIGAAFLVRSLTNQVSEVGLVASLLLLFLGLVPICLMIADQLDR